MRKFDRPDNYYRVRKIKNMKNETLAARSTLPWTTGNALAIWRCLLNQRISEGLSSTVKNIQDMSLFTASSTYIVGKHGWIHTNSHNSDQDDRNDRASDLYESILESGKQGVWYGDGPFERGTYCRVDPSHEGRFVYRVQIEFTESAALEFGRNEDMLILLLNNPVIPLPVQHADLFCPNWDKYHPSVMAWLKEWQEAVKVEEETGFNTMFDF